MNNIYCFHYYLLTTGKKCSYKAKYFYERKGKLFARCGHHKLIFIKYQITKQEYKLKIKTQILK